MENQNFSNIGSKVRKERRAKGLSQSELSKKLGISPSYLNLIESGRRTITVPLLIKIGNEFIIGAATIITKDVNDKEAYAENSSRKLPQSSEISNIL